MLYYKREGKAIDMNTVIIGNNHYATLLSEYLEDSGIHVSAFAVEEEYIKELFIGTVQVISIDKMSEQYHFENTRLIMGIGYKQRGEIRKKLFEKCRGMGYKFTNYIHPSATIDESVQVGEGNVIFENVVIQKHSQIGDGNLFFSNAVVMHDDVIGNYNTCCACSVMNGFVTLENNIFIGSNATIRDHITIKTGTLVGAGTYVSKSCERDMAVIKTKPAEFLVGGGIQLQERI